MAVFLMLMTVCGDMNVECRQLIEFLLNKLLALDFLWRRQQFWLCYWFRNEAV